MTQRIHLKGLLDLTSACLASSPFRHFALRSAVDPSFGDELLTWFESSAPWARQEIPGFYEIHNLDLKSLLLPPGLSVLQDVRFLNDVRGEFSRLFETSLHDEVRVDAHRLSDGRRIRIHTDHGDTCQSHRLLIQLNRGWTSAHGGLLVLLPEASPGQLTEEHVFYPPHHLSAVGFEISSRS